MSKLNAHIAVALSAVQQLNHVGGAEAQQCLRTLRAALLAAEVDDHAIRALVDAVLDRMTTGPMRGPDFAQAVRAALAAVPGIGELLGEASVRVPDFGRADRGAWDLKELTNRTPARREAPPVWSAPVMERRVPRHLTVARPKRFAEGPMPAGHGEDRAAGVDGERMTRLLRALGHGDSPEPPDMGQPALLV